MNIFQGVHRIYAAAGKAKLRLVGKHSVCNLPEWLEIATKSLAVPAKERIIAEINEHYAEAVTSHLAEGLSESDAKISSLAELGDARKAAKRFRKIHMTKFDSTQVIFRFNLAKSRLVMAGGYFAWLMWFLMCFWGVLDGPLNTVNLIFGFFLLVIYPTASFITVRCRSIRFLFLIDVFALILAWSISIYAAYMSGGFSSGLLPFAVWGVLWIYLISNPLRAWLKLRHIPNIHDEVPLQNE
jgi:hypothetical protein